MLRAGVLYGSPSCSLYCSVHHSSNVLARLSASLRVVMHYIHTRSYYDIRVRQARSLPASFIYPRIQACGHLLFNSYVYWYNTTTTQACLYTEVLHVFTIVYTVQVAETLSSDGGSCRLPAVSTTTSHETRIFCEVFLAWVFVILAWVFVSG